MLVCFKAPEKFYEFFIKSLKHVICMLWELKVKNNRRDFHHTEKLKQIF